MEKGEQQCLWKERKRNISAHLNSAGMRLAFCHFSNFVFMQHIWFHWYVESVKPISHCKHKQYVTTGFCFCFLLYNRAVPLYRAVTVSISFK